MIRCSICDGPTRSRAGICTQNRACRTAYQAAYRTSPPLGRSTGTVMGNEAVHRDDGVTEILIKSKKHGDRIALVDTEDWERVSACTWSLRRSNRTFYAFTRARDATGAITTLPLHRVITGRNYVDHANGDGLDNRRSNLRPATQLQNAKNLRRAVNNSSGYTGVFLDKRAGNWRACVWSDRKRHYVPGRFASAAAAAVERDALALRLHGEFVSLALGGE
jgi:hypothetical protein